jgi:hypothetical protein
VTERKTRLIRIDEEVWQAICRQRKQDEPPGRTLRRILGLPKQKAGKKAKQRRGQP